MQWKPKLMGENARIEEYFVWKFSLGRKDMIAKMHKNEKCFKKKQEKSLNIDIAIKTMTCGRNVNFRIKIGKKSPFVDYQHSNTESISNLFVIYSLN